MDWKEALLAQSREMGIDPAGLPDEASGTPASTPDKSYLSTSRLHLVMERKGRAGKTATIIEGFDCDAATIKQIATALKQRLDTGGSTRGSEILIQGDRRSDIFDILKEIGFRHISK